MKKIILMTILLLMSGCGKNIAIIHEADEKTFEYGTKLRLSDLISIEEGNITEGTQVINCDVVGQKEITFKYQDTKKHKGEYSFNINIIDTTPPIISSSNNIYVLKDNQNELIKKALCGDNADRDLVCNIEGEYDISKIGTYELKFTATDSSNNHTEKEFNLHVIDQFDESTTNNSSKNIEDIIKTYKNDKTSIGLDVSSHQKEIDWQQVANSNIEFAMIRVGFGPLQDLTIKEDEYFKANIEGAKNVGLKVGLYYYSYASTMEESNKEIEWLLKTIKDYDIDLPIAYDWESWTGFYGCSINFYDLNNLAKNFMDKLSNEGYDVMNYGSKYYLNSIWNLSEYKTWLAHYTTQTDYDKDYYMWQLTDNAIVPGINTKTDINILYK